MGHLSLSPPVEAGTFAPIGKSFDRVSKDGSIPIITYLIGSHYNAKFNGEMSISATGNITNDSVVSNSGKLEIAGESSDGTEIEKLAAFNSFTFLYPGVKIAGHSEIEDDDVGSGPVPVQRMEYVFEDLATADKLIVRLQGDDGEAHLLLVEEVDGSETVLINQALTAGVKEVHWQLNYLDDGKTKFWYKEAAGSKTRIFNGDVSADLAECKCTAKLVLDQQATKTVKTDFILIFYPNVFITYDVSLTNRIKGRIKIFDDMNEASEADWEEVFAPDHEFTGERIIENGIVRLKIVTSGTVGVEVYGWNGSTYELTGKIIPIDDDGTDSAATNDVVIDIFNQEQCKFLVKYGLVEHKIDLHRGWTHARVFANSKKFKITTTKERFALSVDTPASQLQDFNQLKSDDTNRGNPLNLSPTNNPFTFTNDSDTDTGLLLLDDHWFAYYNLETNDVVGWVAITKRPTGLSVNATSSTELESITWTFDVDALVAVGVLDSQPNTKIADVPKPFHIGSTDEYVKWRADESIFSFNQRQFLTKKR